MTHTEALKLALEAADELAWMLTCGYEVGREGPPRAHRLISKIREFAAQPQQKRPQNCGTGYCSCIECVMEQAQQEPVAWRTFDGEGGYEYRAYEMNEQYAQEWEQCNPKHKGWVEPLYTFPPQPQQEPNEGTVWKLRALQAEAVIEKFMAQPQQEPVGEFKEARFINYPLLTWKDGYVAKIGDKLYTSPPQRKPLSDESNQEPVAYVKTVIEALYENSDPVSVEAAELLERITTPAQRTWVGLTAKEVADIVVYPMNPTADVVKAIEAKLKAKNEN